MRNTHYLQQYLKNSRQSLFTFGFLRLLNLISLHCFSLPKLELCAERQRKQLEVEETTEKDNQKHMVVFDSVKLKKNLRFFSQPWVSKLQKWPQTPTFQWKTFWDNERIKDPQELNFPDIWKTWNVNAVAFFSIWHIDCSETINLPITLKQSLSRWELHFSSRDRQNVIRKVTQTGHGIEESSSKPQTSKHKN